MATIAMLGGAACAFIAWARWNDSPKYAILVVLAVVLFAVGTFTTPKRLGGGVDCYIDWDGRANAGVCD